MKFYLENKEKILKDIIKVCIDYNIDYIVTLAKKGTALFEQLCCDGYFYIPEQNRYVLVYIDRVLYKKDNYDFLNKNILLFDDMMKTGFHFLVTEEHFREKIKLSIENSGLKDQTNFYFYCYVKCFEKKTLLDDKMDKLFCFYKKNYEDYYKFCLSEAAYFQEQLIGNSVDLRVFDLYVKNIDTFKKVVSNEVNSIIYNERDCYIGNEKIKIGSIFIDKPGFVDLFKGFLIAATAKVRYEYNEKNDNYRIVIIPFALTGSIEFCELEDLYKKIFDHNFESEISFQHNKKKIKLSYIKLYRYVNYLISYQIGDYISDIFSIYNLKLNYLDNGSKYYSYKYDSFVKEFFMNENRNISSCLKNFKYSKPIGIDNLKHKTIEYNDMNEHLFKLIIDQSKKSFKNLESHNLIYNLINIQELADIYQSSKENLVTFCNALIYNIDSYLISNEIYLKDNYVIRGFLPGEISVTALPYDGRLFYRGIYSYYQKVSENYNYFMRDYDLFIEIFYNLLLSKKMFNTEFITNKSFDFFTSYFKGLIEDNFKECIEAKKYLLDATKNINKINDVINILDIYLTSSDFEINRG